METIKMELQQLHKNSDNLYLGYAESRIGGRQENQDSYGFADTDLGFLVTVCDGMGGGPGGKTASTIAVNEIIEGITKANADEEKSNIIIKAIRRANMAIIEAGNEEPSLRGMGSTATVLLLSEHSALVAHVGDSRIYQLRGKRKVFRTFDHSMVFDLVKQKIITEEQARLSAQSNIITRALGVNPDIEVDLCELPYEKGDRFVLTTDGIHGTMPEKELIRMLAQKKPVGTVTDYVATHVDNLGRLDGDCHDNLTIAIVETKKKSKLRPTMSKKMKSIFMGVCAICVASIALNIFQASHNNKVASSVSAKTDCNSQLAAQDTTSHKIIKKDNSLNNTATQNKTEEKK